MCNTPCDLILKVRPFAFNLDQKYIKNWFIEDPSCTQFLNVTSTFIPEAELFFIRTAREALTVINDPKLKKEVRTFIGQEAYHRLHHLRFNQLLSDSGYPTKKLEQETVKFFEKIKNKSILYKLACCVALEAITDAIGGYVLLQHIDEQQINFILDFWLWHVLEEAEHKSVLFDVFQHLNGSRMTLKLASWHMRMTMMFVPIYICNFQYVDSSLSLKLFLQNFKFIFSKDKPYRLIGKALSSVSDKNHSPWDYNNNYESLKRWQVRYKIS